MTFSLLLSIARPLSYLFIFFFNDPATTEIYTLSLHDALPILVLVHIVVDLVPEDQDACHAGAPLFHRYHPTREMSMIVRVCARSEEHTSELQSLRHLVCRLLLEKKKKNKNKEKVTVNHNQDRA